MNYIQLLKTLGPTVAYHAGMAKYLGGVNPTLLFCQILYWSTKSMERPDLGVYKSVDELQRETGMTYREQVTARKCLVELGVVKVTRSRSEHRIYFLIDDDAFAKLVTGQNSEDGEATAECASTHMRDAQQATAECAVRTYTENTQEITSRRKSPKSMSLSTKGRQLARPGHEEYSDGFDRFWMAFPAVRKGSKAEAYKVWLKRKLEGDADFIVQNVESKVKSHRKWIDGFAPMATTYLNQSGWTEPLETTGSQGHAKETPFERTQRLQQESREDLVQRARNAGFDF
jgi:hypothetical protein